ncbi:hypothetical protein EV649_5015 [Kribbella sp. VKM Ac-2569]|nr:hypothetical protein EV649_5015 [Kribbella sp. VKM Ac-2569]
MLLPLLSWGFFTLGGNLLDRQEPAVPAADSQSVCAAAYANVDETLKIGIRNPLLLERVNPR